MKKTNEIIKELRELTESTKGTSLIEQFSIADDFDMDMETSEEEPVDDAAIAEEDDMSGLNPIRDDINKIRQITLAAMGRLAKNPTSEAYQMVKKIFLMSDKALESEINENGTNAN